MNKLILLNIIFLLCLNSIFCQQDSISVKHDWSVNTSYLMQKGDWESGIFKNFRYGLNKRIEFHTNPLFLPLIPDAGVKIALGSRNGFTFATDHSLNSPTIFLNLVSRKGIGGLISPQFSFPFMLSVNNSLIISKTIGSTSLLSGNIGFNFSLGKSRPDPQSTIDLPMIYPRMAHFYEGSTLKSGLSFKGKLCESGFYEQEIQVFVITRNTNNFFAENAGTLMWVTGRLLRIKAGYNLTYGRYPFGTHWQLWPSFGLLFGSKRQRELPDYI